MRRRLGHALALLALALPLLASAQNRDEDERLATRVDAALIGHGARHINVEVRAGEVMLSGFVDTQAEGAAVLEAAMGVEGVGPVHDQLFLRDTGRTPEHAVSDGVIASEVKAALVEAQDTAAFEVHVDVRDGVVLLSGFVEDLATSRRALNVAGNVRGVRRVIDGMEVRPER